MKILMCSALALAIATPALAQKTGTASDTQSGTSTTETGHKGKSGKGHISKPSKTDTTSGAESAATSDMAATPATPATPADPSTGTAATPATPATPSAAAAGQANDPATILRTEFPSYDKDASGALNKDEFSSWLLALKNAAPQQTPMTDAQQSEWLRTAFTEADADKSSTISLAELTTYLTRGSKG